MNDFMIAEYESLTETQKEEIREKLSEERKKLFKSISEDTKELSDSLDFEEKIEIQFTKELKASWKFMKAKKEVIEKQTKESDVEIAEKFIKGQLENEGSADEE